MVRMSQGWTDIDDRDLREMVESGWTDREISEALHRSHGAVVARRGILGLRNASPYRRWTPEEDDELIRALGDVGPVIGRSMGAMARRALVLAKRVDEC